MGVLLLVLGSVGVIGLVGRATQPVAGVAIAVARPSGAVVAAPLDAVPASDTGALADPLLAGGVRLSPGACELPALGRAEARMRAFYGAMLDCLDSGWRPALQQAGVRFHAAGLDVSSEASSDCGQMPDEEQATAFYCGADRIIYLPRDRLLRYVGLYEPAHLAVLAHEYGHHVQNLSGTLGAVEELLAGVRAGSPRELELTRRIELQANCFAGLFLASVSGRGGVTSQQAERAVDDFGNSLDSETHGTVRNQLRWARAGFEGRTATACDTWSAAPEAVT